MGLEEKPGGHKLKKKNPAWGGEKIILSETKDELVVWIPLVVRIRPIVIQPQTILIPFQLEDVRIAIGVSSVWCAIYNTASVITICEDTKLYFICDIKSTSRHTKQFFF